MRRFYGVYLESTAISTILDIIRFLGEPDSIRFSHITLRGPYEQGLNRNHLRRLNESIEDRTILMLKAERFLSDWQSTAVITVDLRCMGTLVHKPDFPDGTPHITIYDGKDKEFCTAIYDLSKDYNWENVLRVGNLQEITPKKKIDQEFLPFFTKFSGYFSLLVGDATIIPDIIRMRRRERLEIVRSILEKCTVGTPVVSGSQVLGEPYNLHLALRG